MNKGILADLVAERLGITLSEARESVDAVLDEIARALVRSEDVLITGFGTFTVEVKAPRLGRNPQTGAPVQIPERSVVKFRPGVRLLEYVRGEKTVSEDGMVIGKLPRAGKKKS